MSEIKSLVFKNKTLLNIWRFLNQPLKGQMSRARTRFMRKIQPRIDGVDADRLALLKELAEKDDKGVPIMEKLYLNGQPPQDNFVLTPENQQKMNDFMEEPVQVDFLPEDFKDLDTVKSLILNYEQNVSMEFSEIYDLICDMLEKA